ncbi:hypothetical protein LC586_37915, partial [Nostoc sp. CHAB 5714]|nr:hypothetical protein [Nostoc favosum CHAB5714]
AELFARLERAKLPISPAAQAVLTESLIRQGALDEAWSFYAATHPGTDRSTSRDPRFANDQGSRSSLDWQLFSVGGVSTTLEREDGGNVLAFSVSPMGGGLIVRQMQLLPPGRYVLHGTSGKIDAPEMWRPYWELSCQNGRGLGRFPLQNAGEEGGPFVGRFDVPASCPVQYLSLVARPHELGSSLHGTIYEARLSRAQ